MEKDSSKIVAENKDEISPEKKKLTSKQKEIIITIVVLIAAIIVGFFLGKALYEAMNGPI